jgi:hypothetical protein
VVAEFDRLYRESTGAGPTWNGRSGKQVQRLLKQHGKDEVIRRIGVMFESPPSWMRPPFDIGTLEAHFDKFAITATEAERQHRERQPQKLTPNGLTYGRAEPKLAHEMDPRPPWEIMYERDDRKRREQQERENPPTDSDSPRRPR